MVYKYSLNLPDEPIDFLLKNETNSCSEVKRVTSFKNVLAFTDSGAYPVNVYDPVDKVVLVRKEIKMERQTVALSFNRTVSTL